MSHPSDPSTGRFGWGIIGTGTIARAFADDLALLPDAGLVAVHSRTLDKAHAFSGPGDAATPYDDLQAFLGDPAIDAVYIATPNAAHAGQALASIAAGKPVLIEKPIALSANDVEAMAAAAQTRQVFVMEAMWTRFLPAVAATRRHVGSGAIGTVRRIRADLSYHRPQQPRSRFFDPTLGGGAAFDLGVYPVSLAIDLLGPPQRVTGRWMAADSGVDLRSEFVLHYRDAVAELSCGFDRDGANRFLIEGTGGAIRLDAPFLKAKQLSRYAPGSIAHQIMDTGQTSPNLLAKVVDRLRLPGRRREYFPFTGNGLQFEAAAVMAAVRAGATGCATMPLDQSAAVIRVLEAVLSQPPVASLVHRPESRNRL